MKNIFCIRQRYVSLLFTAILSITIGISATAQNQRNGAVKRERQTEGAITRNQGVARTGGNIQRPVTQPRRNTTVNNNTISLDRRSNTIQRNNTTPRTAETRSNINSRPRNNVSRNPSTANRPAQVASVNNRPRYGSVSRPAYRPVYGYNRPIYSAVNPGWRYGYLPRRNAYYSSLPSTYLTINFGGFGYRYWNGVYYRPYNNLFTVIAPPPGIFINVLPAGYRTVYVRERPYYYYNGIYYDRRDDANYHVVSPPVGAIVESLPAGYETVTIDGETFYTIDGAQYKPSVKENGEIWYEVIKAN